MKARGDRYVEIKKYSAHRSCLSWRLEKQRVSVYSLCIMPWKCVLQSGSSMCHILPLSGVTRWWPVAAKSWRQIRSKSSHWSHSHGIWWVTSLWQENLLSRWSVEISVEDCPSSLFLKPNKIVLKNQGRGKSGRKKTDSRASHMAFGWCKTWAARFMCGTWVYSTSPS